MRYTNRIEQTPDGGWAWSIFDHQQVCVGHGVGCATRQDAEEAVVIERRFLCQIIRGVIRLDGEWVDGYEVLYLPEPPKDDLWGDEVP